MQALRYLVKVASPTWTEPEIRSTVSRPFVTKNGLFGLALGLLSSMRLLSKYCTRCRPLPSGDSLYASSRPGVLGPGPQNHVRLTLPYFNSRSVRFQTRSNAVAAK